MKKSIMQSGLTVAISGNWLIRDVKTLHPTSGQNLDLMVKYSGTHKKYAIRGGTILMNCIHIVKMKASFQHTMHTLIMSQSVLLNLNI